MRCEVSARGHRDGKSGISESVVSPWPSCRSRDKGERPEEPGIAHVRWISHSEMVAAALRLSEDREPWQLLGAGAVSTGHLFTWDRAVRQWERLIEGW